MLVKLTLGEKEKEGECPLLFIGHSNEIREEEQGTIVLVNLKEESRTRIMIKSATYSGHSVRIKIYAEGRTLLYKRLVLNQA